MKPRVVTMLRRVSAMLRRIVEMQKTIGYNATEGPANAPEGRCDEAEDRRRCNKGSAVMKLRVALTAVPLAEPACKAIS